MSFSVPVNRIQLSQETLLAAIGDDWPPEQVEVALELLANSSGKFPSGVRKLPSDLIRAIQRERLIVAMLNAAADLGYLETNVQDVIDRAGVSRPTFYEHFSNKEDCFLAAFDTSAERLRKSSRPQPARAGTSGATASATRSKRCSASPAASPTPPARWWSRRAPPARRRLGVVSNSWTSSPAASNRRLASSFPRVARTTALTASGIVGGVESLLYSRLCKQEYDQLESLLPSLMYFVVLPYEGHEAASEAFAVN